jgi:hypothetical protein
LGGAFFNDGQIARSISKLPLQGRSSLPVVGFLNLKTAKALKLTLPSGLLSIADEVTE